MINESRIAELKADVGEDDFAEVVELFCEEVEGVLAELEITTQDALPEKLHFLKGSAQNVGLDQVARLCMAAEANLKTHPMSRPEISPIHEAYWSAKPLLLG